MIGGALLAKGLGFAGRALAIGITIPLWLILIAGAWLYFDRSSAIREAVDRAVTRLVDGAELEAARAREEALRKILADREIKAERDRAALARFSELLASAETEREGLADELAELAARPLDAACVVDRALLERLRR